MEDHLQIGTQYIAMEIMYETNNYKSLRVSLYEIECPKNSEIQLSLFWKNHLFDLGGGGTIAVHNTMNDSYID